ncbi:MAG: outer membrane lipoprotein chaperone LolA [Betaproteobacteria bacterium]|nr:outer membrane lipoprotein chaperone LolA [Betaproteobacteria bacterium]
MALKALLAPLLFLLSIGCAHADALADFRGFINGTQSARADFSQTVFDNKNNITQEAKGTLVFTRPGKFRWQYLKPAQLIVGDGSQVWFFDEDLNQVTIRKIEKTFSSTPAALLAGKRDIEAAFTLIDGGQQDGLAWLNAEPKQKDAGIEKIRLGFANNQLTAMELLDAFGNRTRLTFSKFERNPTIDAKQYRFTPPKGADVIAE